MSVSIHVIGNDTQSDEYNCANKLKTLIETALPSSASGSIILHANATMMGQTVKDIDILMIGKLNGYHPKLLFVNGAGEEITAPVLIQSFCTAIEIKSHSFDGIVREGTDFLVRYGADLHSVTNQSNQQKFAVKNYISHLMNGHSPYITNLIWFVGLTSNELDNMLYIGDAKMQSNVMSAEVKLDEMMQLLVWQATPSFFSGMYRYNAYLNNDDPDDIDRVFTIFDRVKNQMGDLSRKKIEQITSKAVDNKLDLIQADKFVICRGRAGTGKTIGLIRLALKLIDKEDARVLVLTYNRALVSDIKRLFALSNLPDMFQPSCVEIMSLQSFFFKLVNVSLYDGSLQGQEFLQNYAFYLEQLKAFLNENEETRELFLEELRKDASLRWDYCFVDEAQDWTALERDILFELFEKNQIVVADGGNQFVRSSSGCDWNVVNRNDRETIKLKKCLRQKENLIAFNNHILEAVHFETQAISSSGRLPGGKVLIRLGRDFPIQLISEQLDSIRAAGNIPYDLMCFVPSNYSFNGHFGYTEALEAAGIKVWDGTNSTIRREVPLIGDEIRVLHYESGRGLEAWTCVCVEFDRFIAQKMHEYVESTQPNPLLLESKNDRRKRYFVNWALIPLTRAIDTTIITIADPTSEISKIILSIAEQHPDYIEIV